VTTGSSYLMGWTDVPAAPLQARRSNPPPQDSQSAHHLVWTICCILQGQSGSGANRFILLCCSDQNQSNTLPAHILQAHRLSLLTHTFSPHSRILARSGLILAATSSGVMSLRGPIEKPDRMVDGFAPQESRESACMEHGADTFESRAVEALGHSCLLRGVMYV
jgi:hypothetical protein